MSQIGGKILDFLDKSHIFEKISKIPESFITEIVVLVFIINLAFGYVYHMIYLNDKTSFKNIHNTDKDIQYFDFFYYSNTTFFSLGYDLVPQTRLSKILTIIQLKIGFIFTAIIIAKLLSYY